MNGRTPAQRIRTLAWTVVAFGWFAFLVIPMVFVDRDESDAAFEAEMEASRPAPAAATTGVFSHVSDPPTGVLRYQGPRHLASSDGQVIRTCLDEACTKASDWSRKVVVDDGDMIQARAAVVGE